MRLRLAKARARTLRSLPISEATYGVHAVSEATTPSFQTSRGQSLPPPFLQGGGEAGALLRGYDWSACSLGLPEQWPVALQTLVGVMLGSNQPMFVSWGTQQVLLYNDAYAAILATKHPAAMGQDFLEVWEEIRDDLLPIVEQAYRGEPVQMDDIELWLERKGFREEAHFAFSYTPVRGEAGTVGGFFCVCQEITQQVEAKRKLRESEERAKANADRVRLALDAGAIIGTWFWDLPSDSFTVDEQFARAFGIDPSLGRNGLSLEQVIATVHPDDRSGLMAAIEAAIERGGPYAHQYRVCRTDGEYRWIEANGRVDMGADGKAVSFPGVLLDVEERRQTETALRASEEFNRRVLGSSGDCIKVLNLEGRLEFMSEGGMGVMEVDDFDHARGAYWPDFWEGDEKAKVTRAMEEAKGGATGRLQGFATTMKGSPRWWDVVVTPINNAAGQPEKLLAVSRDITATMEAQATLRETTRKLDAILNNTREAVFLMDHRQHCVYANAAAETLTGYRAEELQGRPLHDVVHHKKPDGSHYPIEECPIDRAFPARAQMSGEELFVARDGSFYPVGFTASPVLDEGGSPIGTVIEARNIAEEKARDEALQEQKLILETLNRVGAAVAAELDLERVVQTVADAGVALTGAQFGAFYYNAQTDAGKTLVLYTLSGIERSEFESLGMPLAKDVFPPKLEGDGIIRSDDILADPRYSKNAPHQVMPQGHLQMRSYLAVPVASRSGKVIGGLFFGHPKPGQFSKNHETLMLGIAGQAAIAMDNAHLYREAQLEIEQRRKAEERQHLLINELNHRVKNTLAIVQSLAQQSFKRDVPPEAARANFSARLSALAAAHNLLTQRHWEKALLSEIIFSSVQATAGAASARVASEGPEVVVSPQTAVSIAMAIHELSTNAIKYGALSNAVGSIAVTWKVSQGGDRPRLRLDWKEIGGPAVTAPTRKGFGTRMIEQGLAAELQGQVSLEFAPHGLHCAIDAPLPEA